MGAALGAAPSLSVAEAGFSFVGGGMRSACESIGLQGALDAAQLDANEVFDGASDPFGTSQWGADARGSSAIWPVAGLAERVLSFA